MTAPPLQTRTFGQAIRAARRKLRWSQTDVGKRVGVCRDVVGRWETGLAKPGAKSRVRLLALVRSFPGDAGLELRALLGDDVPALSGSLDEVVRRAAEELDVKTRAFRLAIDAVLAAISGAGLSLDQARKIVAPRAARSK